MEGMATAVRRKQRFDAEVRATEQGLGLMRLLGTLMAGRGSVETVLSGKSGALEMPPGKSEQAMDALNDYVQMVKRHRNESPTPAAKAKG